METFAAWYESPVSQKVDLKTLRLFLKSAVSAVTAKMDCRDDFLALDRVAMPTQTSPFVL